MYFAQHYTSISCTIWKYFREFFHGKHASLFNMFPIAPAGNHNLIDWVVPKAHVSKREGKGGGGLARLIVP